jgi:hypothetical protein
MSVGNINSYGDKKNNFNFQYKVLQGIASLASFFNGSTNGAARTTQIIRPSTSGSIPAGIYSVSIANVGSGNGTVKGTILKQGEVINLDAGAINNTLDTIDYDATGTEFLIAYVS